MDHWTLPTTVLSLAKPPLRMGIVNVTPDSFSDGGQFFDASDAMEQALRLVAAGADILDIGGESTRPGSEGISLEEELRRVIPVVHAVKKRTNIPVSVDTVKSEVAAEAIRAGAAIVNDVSGLGDPRMIPLLQKTGAAICVMHARGTPKTMQLDPRYENVVEDVFTFLEQKRDLLLAAGIERSRIAVDPGIGFGKTVEHNWTLIRNMRRFLDLDCPLLVGHSRKRFLVDWIGNRDLGTEIVSEQLIRSGVQILRLHDLSSNPFRLRTAS